MENGQVRILFDDGDAMTHSAADISAVIPDKLPDPMTLKRTSHVIVSCESPFHHIGFVDTGNHDRNVGVVCDQCGDICIPVSKVRLFAQQTIPHEVGARVFAWWTNGVYYHGFITSASDLNVFVNYDDGDTVTLDKPDRTTVILDVIPQMTEILLNEHVIGF